jgi:voltage-gated potassium channel
VVDRKDDLVVYITSIYWVVTTLTTVGYGDFKGYQTTEYALQMVVEFIGIGIFSYLMGSINNLVGSE